MEIWDGKPLKKGGGVIIGKHTLDNIKKCNHYQKISETFSDVCKAMKYVCIENIRLVRRLPEKVVIEVEVR